MTSRAVTGLAAGDNLDLGRSRVQVAAWLDLEAPFEKGRGRTWMARAPTLEEVPALAGCRAALRLLEDGRALAPYIDAHADVRRVRGGAHSYDLGTVYFTTPDGSDPNTNGRRYAVLVPDHQWDEPPQLERDLVPPFVADGGRMWRTTLHGSASWSDADQLRFSRLRLYEDGVRLGPEHAFHDHIREAGGGAWSHWGDTVYFSSSDGSDPSTNGRRYTFTVGERNPTPRSDAKAAYLERWYAKHERFHRDPVSVWDSHPEGAWFRERGGDVIAPPIYANLIGLTSHCNLKCTICGSQEAIDHEGIPRRAMDPEVLLGVSETVFPTLLVLILASLGEPTIYPRFNEVLEQAHRWGVAIKIESNATALTPRMIDLLTSVKGELFFSIDATGEVFEAVRVGASWSKVDANVRALMERRDPELTRVKLYPTISRRTLPEMLAVARWGLDVGVEEISFHSYDPTMFAKEERPSPEEFAVENERLVAWLDEVSSERDVSRFSVKVNGIEINGRFAPVTSDLANLPKNHPITEAEYASHTHRCRTPQQNVDIGPDGQIYPCVWSGVRPQENTMGLATSKEDFARTWFGERYVDLRAALAVGSTTTPNVAQCESCLKRYALSGDRMA